MHINRFVYEREKGKNTTVRDKERFHASFGYIFGKYIFCLYLFICECELFFYLFFSFRFSLRVIPQAYNVETKLNQR